VNELGRALRPRFHGDGGSLFVIHLKNLLLTIITLGIYSFWAKTEVRKYLYGQVSLAGDRFQYHGTGGELLKGWAKAFGIYIVIAVGSQIVSGTISVGIGASLAAVVGLFVLMSGIVFFLVPLALLGTRRYRLSRSSWRGIRFSFRGSNVNHYNVRFVEQGGRTVQKEISTFSGSNLSKWWRVRGRNGQQVTVQVQACSRGGVFSSSKCTGWTTITLTLL